MFFLCIIYFFFPIVLGKPPLSPASPAASVARGSPTPMASPMSLQDDWLERFELPLSRLSQNLTQLLMEGKRPEPRERLEMVRVIVDEMHKFCAKPLKKHTDAVAKRIVGMYRNSLGDQIAGESVISGFGSLAKQLIARVENCSRSNNKSPNCSGTTDAVGVDGQQNRKRKLLYGLVNAHPKGNPEVSGVELKKKQGILKDLYEVGEDKWAFPEIEKFMGETFAAQRTDINNGMTVDDLKNEWPFFFHEIGMITHFNLVMDMNVEGKLSNSSKISKLWAFLKGRDTAKYPQTYKVNHSDYFDAFNLFII